MRSPIFWLAVVACGGGSGGGDDDVAACTPAEQMVTGTEIVFDQIEYQEPSGSCVELLVSSSNELAAHFNGTPPQQLATVDFSVDRIYLGTTNPVVRFVVDTGGTLVIAEEPICQGIAPMCVAHVLHGTVGDATMIKACPYRGPDPCDVP